MSGRQLLRRQGLQDVELVTVGVGHNRPRDLPLADAYSPGAERPEHVLVSAMRVEDYVPPTWPMVADS